MIQGIIAGVLFLVENPLKDEDNEDKEIIYAVKNNDGTEHHGNLMGRAFMMAFAIGFVIMQ